MPYPDEHLFIDAVQRVVKDNIEFVPPYGCDGSLYIRPFVFGSGPMLGLQPSDEYYFIVYVNPVGSYYKGGIVKPSKALIQHGFDRAAPFGMGSVKLAGNYAPTLLPTQKAIEKGYTVLLFLDSKTNKYVEEFATSNFAALTKPDANGKRTYVTPLSNSILASVTNRSLSELAANHFNWAVERRQVEWSEIQTGQFDEICACGTAVVITPIGQIDREIPQNPINPTPKTDIATMWDDDFEEPIIKLETVKLGDDVKGFKMLYDLYRQIQNGDVVDKYNWMYPAQGL
ncbi:aminotransferase [Globomyces pollinis-pini]|nr:aminotransferase [Globomyces pollinis-pini]